MTGLFENQAFLLLGVVALAWFAMRYFYGAKRGGPSLSGMFRKEKAPERRGMGRKAIAGMLDDIERLVAQEPDFKGALLIGAFAAGMALPKNRVEIIVLVADASMSGGPECLAAWAYPRRGHDILSHEVQRKDGVITHQLRLRGAPEVAMHIVNADSAALPPPLAILLAEGALVVSAGMGTSGALERWKNAKG